MKILQQIQSELKCAKNNYNAFGKYKYRSCEDICEAVKPLLAKYGCSLTLTDQVIQIGERYYVEATAIIWGSDGETVGQTKGYAREESEKKGMDGSQITGTASSYARKYALNGLLLIDDSQDSDSTNNGTTTTQAKPATPKMPTLDEICKQINACTTMDQLTAISEKWKSHSYYGALKGYLNAQAKKLQTPKQ